MLLGIEGRNNMEPETLESVAEAWANMQENIAPLQLRARKEGFIAGYKEGLNYRRAEIILQNQADTAIPGPTTLHY